MNKIDLFNQLLIEGIFENEIVEETCLISDESLEDNYITLNCGHKFNYDSIYNQIKTSKINKRSGRYRNNISVKINQFQCPYCRKIQTGLIPHRNGYDRVVGLNWPPKMYDKKYVKKCCHIFKRGKNKGKECGILTYDGNYCKKHTKYVSKKISNECGLHWKQGRILGICQHILLRGPNKGKKCGSNVRVCTASKKTSVDNMTVTNCYCRKHKDKYGMLTIKFDQ